MKKFGRYPIAKDGEWLVIRILIGEYLVDRFYISKKTTEKRVYWEETTRHELKEKGVRVGTYIDETKLMWRKLSVVSDLE